MDSPTRHPIHDVVVVVPGILGSTLEQHGVPVWTPSAGAALRAITTFGRSIADLTLEAGIGDSDPDDGVKPVALMPDLHLLPGVWSWNIGYGVLLNWLQKTFTLQMALPGQPEVIPNLIPFPYDWRLSNRTSARQLKQVVEPALERWRVQGGPCAEARLIFLCHSMGGLVARWFLEKEGGAEHTRRLITMGTPHRGALQALAQLVNGVRVPVGPKRLSLRLDLGPFGITRFARSLPSLHELLPQYACLESGSSLARIDEVSLPQLDGAMVENATAFHGALDDSGEGNAPSGWVLHPIVGIRQPTPTTGGLVGGQLETIFTIKGENEAGDGAVPRLSATPRNLATDSPSNRYVADQHGGLQSNRSLLDELEGVLTARPVIHRAATGIDLGLTVEPLLLAGTPLEVHVDVADGERVGLLASLIDESGRTVEEKKLRLQSGGQGCRFEPDSPGVYRIVVKGAGTAAARVAPAQSVVAVLPLEAVE